MLIGLYAASRALRLGKPPAQALLLALALLLTSTLGVSGALAQVEPSAAASGWLQHGGHPEAQRYSELDQIHRGNVADIRLAWSAELGHGGSVQGSPAVANDLLVVSIPDGLLALDAATGAIRWRTVVASTPGPGASVLPSRAPRGSPVIRGDRVFSVLREPTVFALDLATGALLWQTDVGIKGLAEGFSSNPIDAGGLIVVGPTNADFGAAPGRIIALDPDDGAVRWTFYVVPQSADDPGWSTWSPTAPDWRWGIGGASAWNLGAFDPITNTVVYGTGQPKPTERLDPRRRDEGPASADWYSSGFVGLDAADGTLRWFHQVIPGDEWEYDQHTVPIIADLEVAGEQRRVAMLSTTTGFLVLIDLHEGRFVTAHQLAPESNVHLGYTPAGEPIIDDSMRFLGERPSTQVCPGSRWANIAPGAFHPITGLVYRPNDTVCERQGLRPSIEGDASGGFGELWLAPRPRLAEDFYERWGALSAIDPVSGALRWSFESGYPHDAGVLATAGMLVFSVFADRFFRAFDADTGEVLFQQPLTAHGEGSPITYLINGVQYLAVLVGHERGVEAMPSANLPPSIPGPAVLFVFALEGAAAPNPSR